MAEKMFYNIGPGAGPAQLSPLTPQTPFGFSQDSSGFLVPILSKLFFSSSLKKINWQCPSRSSWEFVKWRRDTRHNDTRHNDIQHSVFYQV